MKWPIWTWILRCKCLTIMRTLLNSNGDGQGWRRSFSLGSGIVIKDKREKARSPSYLSWILIQLLCCLLRNRKIKKEPCDWGMGIGLEKRTMERLNGDKCLYMSQVWALWPALSQIFLFPSPAYLAGREFPEQLPCLRPFLLLEMEDFLGPLQWLWKSVW